MTDLHTSPLHSCPGPSCKNLTQALPRSVPSAVDTFTPQEAEQVQLPAAVAAIKQHAAKMQASWASCRPDAIGGADLQTYRWAHTVSSAIHGLCCQHLDGTQALISFV